MSRRKEADGRWRRKCVGVDERRRSMVAAGEPRMVWKRGGRVAMQAAMKAEPGVNGEERRGGEGNSCGGNGIGGDGGGGNGGKADWCKGEAAKGSVE